MGIKKDKICCIYKIINIKNGKFYLGSSNNFKQRVKRHKRDLKFNRHHNIYLQRIYNKYGHNISATASGGDMIYNHPNREAIIERSKQILEDYKQTEAYKIDLNTLARIS